MHGTDMGDPSSPTGAVALEQCEQIVGMFGSAGGLIYSIGFRTSLGRVYGPWGSTRGDPFSYPGVVYGFYGGEKWGSIAAIGAWVAILTPPPPPSPPLPASPPPPTRGMLKSPLFGASGDLTVEWDDGPSRDGQPCSNLYFDALMEEIIPNLFCASIQGRQAFSKHDCV
jgi:hypothetical protein